MVDDAEAGAADDGRIVHIVGEPLGELLALPHSVDPVRVAAVTAADVNGHRQLGLDLEAHRRTGGIGGIDGGAGGNPCARTVVNLHPWPAQLFDPAVTPDPSAVVHGTEPAGILLNDHDNGKIIEGHRHVQPPHAFEGRVGGTPGRFGFADRPDTP